MSRLFIALATLILVAAAFLRIHQLHHYPPGPHYDEAAEVLITRSIAFGGAWYFPIVPEYQGREVLFYYLSAPLMYLIGDGVFTLRVANVFLNLLTIAASMALGRTMFRGQRGLIIGLVVGALICINFPMLWLSRQAFRTGPLPLCQAFALWCLWRGVNTSLDMRAGLRPAPTIRATWLIAGGVFGGLALYTYMASRLFPLWLLLGGLALLVIDWRQRGLRLRQGAVFFAALVITALPMTVYAAQHPDIFMGRLAEVTETDEAVTLETSIKRHINMFFVEGETYLRYNIPGRPYFTRPEGYLLLLGMGIAGWRLFRKGRPSERAAYFMALLSPLMVIPSVISVGGLPPNHMRSIGMVPLVFVLIGVGVEGVFGFADWVGKTIFSRVGVLNLTPLQSQSSSLQQSRGEALLRPYTIPIILVLMLGTLIVGGMQVYREYFAWAGRADLYYEADADLAAAARWLPMQVDENTLVYIGGRYREHPTILIENLRAVTWLGTDSLFRAPEGKTGLYIFPNRSEIPESWLEWLRPGEIRDLPIAPDEKPAFMAFRLAADTALPESAIPPNAIVQNAIVTLVGLHTPPIFAGARGTITTEWRIDQTPTSSDLRPILELTDSQGVVLSHGDPFLTNTDQWRPGEVLFQRVGLEVPAGTTLGFYPIRVSWADRESGNLIPFINGGITTLIGEIEIILPREFPDPSVLAIEHRETVEVIPGARLLGWNPAPASLRPGEILPMTLFWQGTAVEGEREPVEYEVLLCDEAETCLSPALFKGIPVHNSYSSEHWREGELVTDYGRWTIPRDLPSGRYNIVLRASDLTIYMGIIDIVGVPRVFDPPTVETIVEADFGGVIQLRGYTLRVDDGEINLDLAWKSLENIHNNYTVFIHFLDQYDAIIVQRDTMPLNNAYPTSLWQTGEFVLDRYVFTDLPPGEYYAQVGLYDQQSGERLFIPSSRDFSNYVSTHSITISS